MLNVFSTRARACLALSVLGVSQSVQFLDIAATLKAWQGGGRPKYIKAFSYIVG